MLKFTVTCYYGKQSFEGFVRGIFTSTGPQLVTPQPTAPIENIYFEIPSGMIEKLLSNPYVGHGTLHPDMHLIYVDEVCGLFKLAGMPEDVIKKKVLPLSLKGKALTWFRLSSHSLYHINVSPFKDKGKTFFLETSSGIPASLNNPQTSSTYIKCSSGCFVPSPVKGLASNFSIIPEGNSKGVSFSIGSVG